MSTTRRRERVAETIGETLSILLSQAADERLSAVTVRDVEVNQDLSAAKVWVTSAADEVERREALAALEHAQGFLRREIAEALDLRRAPTLTFHYDDSMSRAQRVMELFDQLEAEKKLPEDTQPDTAHG